jgi:hypothetical protein
MLALTCSSALLGEGEILLEQREKDEIRGLNTI